MAFTRPAGGYVYAQFWNDIIAAWEGDAGKGQRLQLTAINDAANYALDIRNLDAANSKGLRVRDASGSGDSVLLTVEKSAIAAYRNIVVGSGVLIDTIALATHDHSAVATKGVQLDHGGLANLIAPADPHSQYYNSARHNAALHAALLIDAATLGGHAAAYFAPWADFKCSESVYASANWALPAAGAGWSDVDTMSIGPFTLANTCDVLILFKCNIEAKASDYTGTWELRAYEGSAMEEDVAGAVEAASLLSSVWYKAGLAAGAHTIKMQFQRQTTGAARNMTNRRLAIFVIPKS